MKSHSNLSRGEVRQWRIPAPKSPGKWVVAGSNIIFTENRGLVSMKTQCTFWPPDMQKTQEFPGFFWCGIFFVPQNWWTM